MTLCLSALKKKECLQQCEGALYIHIASVVTTVGLTVTGRESEKRARQLLNGNCGQRGAVLLSPHAMRCFSAWTLKGFSSAARCFSACGLRPVVLLCLASIGFRVGDTHSWRPAMPGLSSEVRLGHCSLACSHRGPIVRSRSQPAGSLLLGGSFSSSRGEGLQVFTTCATVTPCR